MTFSFEKKLILSFAVLLTGIVAAGIATYKNNQSEDETDYWVQHAREVLYESSELLSDVQDILLGTRGYIITGNSAFLQPVDNSIGRISENGEKLENLVKDNAGQQQRVDSVRKLMDKLIQYSLQLIELRNSKGFAEAQQLIASREGNFYIDEIRRAVRAIQQEENRLLSERQAAHLKASAAYNRSFYLLMGTLMGLLMLVLFAVNYNLRVRKKAEEELLAYKNKLEENVIERTYELRNTVEELKRNQEILDETSRLAKMGGWEINLTDMSWKWTNEVYHIHELEPGKLPSIEEAINFYAPEVRPAILEAMNKSIETGEAWDMELPFITAKGKNIWVRTICRTEIKDGKIVRLFGVLQDITGRKKDKLKFEEQYKELEKTNIELDRFVYSTSHDLRAPLKSMLGLIKLTKADAEPGNRELHKRLDMLNKSITRLDDFIEEILDYSRNTRLEVAKDEINFEELIQEIRANHKFMEEAKGLNLQVKIQQQGKFVSDKRRLKVVLNNLISNAIKYSDVSKEKSFVKIFVECRGENAIATVEDNGIGIAEKDKVKIFEMFYRASTLSSGSGLGLYIVKETIEKLGGAIYLESELNKGTKFTVTIPNLIID
jgi:signal transduction histidine kinase